MTERMDVLTGRQSKDGEKTYWTRLGVAFRSRDGEGWNIDLDGYPVNGKLIMRPPKKKEEASAPQSDAPPPSPNDYGDHDPWNG